MNINYSKILEMPNTIDVIIKCWRIAEESMQQNILNFHSDVDEEFITCMFHGKFAAALKDASEKSLIEQAFIDDLRAGFPHIGNELDKAALGLVADVTLHKRHTERITGGDFGLLLIRPQIQEDGYYLTKSDYRRGLLCQAKLKSRLGKWGRFTPNQRKVLPSRLSYLSLLLYEYSDSDRKMIKPFHWQNCNEYAFHEVEDWLSNGQFPDPYTSDHTIAKLGYGLIGTDDVGTLDEIVCPTGNPKLVIKIDWPDGKGPGWPPGPSSRIYIESSVRNCAENFIRIRY